jgi:hypothetical protein
MLIWPSMIPCHSCSGLAGQAHRHAQGAATRDDGDLVDRIA